MNYAPILLEAANSAGICSAYYKLCNEFPFTPGVCNKKLPHKEILAAADRNIPLSKLAGPGTVLSVEGLPNGVSLVVVVQTGGSIETGFSIQHAHQENKGTFAILCNEARKFAGLPVPNPAYPRPICATAAEMTTVFVRLKELTLAFANAVQNAG